LFRFLFQTAYDFPDAYRTSNPLDRAQELSRPPTVPDAVFSQQRFNSVASAGNGLDLEFPSAAAEPKPITEPFFPKNLMAFVITTIGYATYSLLAQPMVTSKVV